MKILILNGSPRQGSCDRITREVYSHLSGTERHQIKATHLREKNIAYCLGCLRCEDEGICPLNDDGGAILNDMLWADCIVFVTPVYFDNVPAIVKNLIDRTNLIVSGIKGKSFILCTTGQADEVSWKNCTDFIKNYCDIVGLTFLGSKNILARNLPDISEETMKETIEEIEKYVANIL